MRHAVLALALLFLSAPLSLSAQAYTSATGAPAVLSIDPGAHVRVTSSLLAGKVVDARLVQVRPGVIDISIGSDPAVQSLRWEQIEDLAVRRAVTRGQRMRKGIAWGLYLGASLGGMIAPFATYGLDSDVKDWQAIGLGVGGGALAGSAIGALVGPSVFSGSSWEHYRFAPAK